MQTNCKPQTQYPNRRLLDAENHLEYVVRGLNVLKLSSGCPERVVYTASDMMRGAVFWVFRLGFMDWNDFWV